MAYRDQTDSLLASLRVTVASRDALIAEPATTQRELRTRRDEATAQRAAIEDAAG